MKRLNESEEQTFEDAVQIMLQNDRYQSWSMARAYRWLSPLINIDQCELWGSGNKRVFWTFAFLTSDQANRLVLDQFNPMHEAMTARPGTHAWVLEFAGSNVTPREALGAITHGMHQRDVHVARAVRRDSNDRVFGVRTYTGRDYGF